MANDWILVDHLLRLDRYIAVVCCDRSFHCAGNRLVWNKARTASFHFETLWILGRSWKYWWSFHLQKHRVCTQSQMKSFHLAISCRYRHSWSKRSGSSVSSDQLSDAVSFPSLMESQPEANEEDDKKDLDKATTGRIGRTNHPILLGSLWLCQNSYWTWPIYSWFPH